MSFRGITTSKYQKNRGKRGRRFNSSSYRGRNNQDRRGGGHPHPLSRLADDDEDMGDTDVLHRVNRHNPYGRRQRRPYHQQGRGGRRSVNLSHLKRMGLPINDRDRFGDDQQMPVHNNSSDWFKIKVIDGKQMGKDDLLKELQSRSTNFTPVQFHFDRNDVVFYVRGGHIASGLRNLHNKIVLPKGHKASIIVKKEFPRDHMSDDVIKKLEVCMSGRYDLNSRSLDLQDLIHDDNLGSHGIRLPLNRADVMHTVVEIIEKHIPEVTSIDLRQNMLYNFKALSGLVMKTKDMRKLDVSNNKIRNLDEFAAIKDWELTELDTRDNDLRQTYGSGQDHINVLRGYFPKLIILDGNTLPPQITFDIDTSAHLPPFTGSYFGDDSVRDVLVAFITRYFEIFDSESRQSLLQAYSEDAIFSWGRSSNSLSSQRYQNWGNNYESRNLIHNTDSMRRQKCLKTHNIRVIAALSDLPATKHDLQSFTVDVLFKSNEVLIFSVDGLFKDVNPKSKKEDIFAFSRLFVTVPRGTGMVIANDMLRVTLACDEETKNAFKTPAPTPASSPIPAPSLSSPLEQSQPSLEEKQIMTKQFSDASQMNLEWSSKALEENQWDFNRAALAFQKVQAQGGIPPEAFMK